MRRQGIEYGMILARSRSDKKRGNRLKQDQDKPVRTANDGAVDILDRMIG
jgi:hypothetical protein